MPQWVETRLGAVECERTGQGPAVLLLHGAMGGWDQSLLLGRAAIGPANFEFFALSRPGYLGTPLALGRTPAEQVDLYAAVLDALDIRQAAAIGVSAGGPSALQFALRYPERCRTLAMIAACSASLAESVPFRFHVMSVLAHVPALVARMRRKVADDPESAARRSMPDAALRAQTLNDPEVGPLYREFQSCVMERMVERLPGTKNDIAQTRAPFSYPVEAIRTPALIVHGTADEAVPFAQAESLAARLPCAELLAIPEGRHVSLFTHRRLIQPRVRQFLAANFI